MIEKFIGLQSRRFFIEEKKICVIVGGNDVRGGRKLQRIPTHQVQF